jgi:predicted alpha/beta hydrolase family esterase
MATSHFEHPFTAPLVLLLPDLDSDSPSYWQRQWAASRSDASIVDLGSSHRPDRNNWITRIDHATRCAGAPILLVGHGAGALAIAWWAMLCAQENESTVAGALLIGPSHPAAMEHGDRLASFAPSPQTILPFPSLVVASENDPALPVDHAFSIARQWGSGFARFGDCGRFGVDDGLGAWQQGEQLLNAFIDLIEPGHSAPAGQSIDLMSGLVAQSHRPASQLPPLSR